MPDFEVEVYFTGRTTVEVSAVDESQARELAEREVFNGRALVDESTLDRIEAENVTELPEA